jgi:hypothetical protein
LLITNQQDSPVRLHARERQPRLLLIRGRYDLSFDPGKPERYRKDVPNAEVHERDQFLKASRSAP